MATISSRLTNTGNLLVNGSFDEFTGVPVIDGNVVLWLDAGQNTSYSGSGNTWADLSTNILNGTLTNSPTYNPAGYFGFIRTLSQRVNFAANTAINFLGTTNYTLEAWLYPTALSPQSNYAGIFNHEDTSTGARDGWNFWIQSNSSASTTFTFGTERFGNGVQSVGMYSIGSSTILNTWQHMVATYDGSNIRMYRNGILVSGPVASSQAITNNIVQLTVASRGTGSHIDADIAAAKIYNRALSSAEIIQNYNALAPRFGIATSANATTLTRQTINTILANNFDEVTFNSVNPIIINQFTYSEDFSNVAWQKSGATITSDQAIAPNGTYTADLMSATGLYPRINRPAAYTVTNGQSFTHTIFVKYINQQYCNMVQETWPGSWFSRFDLINGTYTQSANVTASMSSVGNGWYRCRNTYVVPTGQTSFQPQFRIGSYDGTNYAGSNVYVWGAQLEGGTSATIYQGISAANALVPSTTVKKIDTTGGYYLQGSFDEFTGAPVVDGNLKLWLDAGQTSSYAGSGATWTDLSGLGNNGTLVSSPTFDSITGGGSFTFNGTSFVSLAANLVPTGSRSITIAFQSSNVSTRVGLISNRDSGGWFCCLNRGGNSNINYDHASSGGVEGLTASNVITALNTWYISTITYNVSTGNASIYLNGNLVAGPTTISPIAPVGALNSCIAREINSSSNLIGKVGDVIVYDRALSADEIATNFNALRGRYGI